MNATDDGGPAFPFPTTGANGETCTSGNWAAAPGMSLRDWFAGQALAGFLAMHADPHCPLPEINETVDEAYAYADAMLAARKEKTP